MANWLPRDLRDDFEADNYEAQAAQIISGATARIKQATQAASDTVSGAVQGATDAVQTATSGVGDLLGGLVASWQDDEQPQQPAAPTLAGSWEDPTAPRPAQPVRPASGTPVGMPTAPRRVLPSTGEELADPVITTGPLDNSSREAFVRTAYGEALKATGGDERLARQLLATAISENGNVGSGRDLGAEMGFNVGGIQGLEGTAGLGAKKRLGISPFRGNRPCLQHCPADPLGGYFQ